MSEYVSVTQDRRIGITVDVGDGEVRPIWRRVIIEWPDGDIKADIWDVLSPTEKSAFLKVDSDGA